MSDERAAQEDRRGDRATVLIVSGAMFALFSIASATQTIFIYQPADLDAEAVIARLPELGLRVAANLSAAGIVILGAAVVRLERRRRVALVLSIVVIALVGAAVRFLVQLALGLYVGPSTATVVVENVSAFGVGVVSMVFAVVLTRMRVLLRREVRARSGQELRAANALAALSAEELKVRREIAEGLHGTVQQQLVLADVQLGGAIERLRAEGAAAPELEELGRLRDSLDRLREHDVRELSQLLYPVGVDLGLAEAVRLIVRRIPASIQVDLELDERLRSGTPLSEALAVDRRVAIVRLVEEGITNALRHGSAGRIALRISVAADSDGEATAIVVRVEDDGSGLDPGAVRHGLARLEERFEQLGGRLEISASSLGGAGLSARLPLSS